MSRYSPILWDLDGTIIDSGPEIAQRVTRVAREFGYADPTPQQLSAFIGPPLVESYERILGMSPEQAQDAFVRSRELAMAQSPDYLVALHEGVAQLIHTLHERGVPQAIASAKGQWAVERTAEHFGLADCMTVLGGADPHHNRVSKNEVVAWVLDQLRGRGVDCERAVLIGDRVHDLRGGLHNGIPVIIVEWGYGGGEATPGAAARVSSVAALRRLLSDTGGLD